MNGPERVVVADPAPPDPGQVQVSFSFWPLLVGRAGAIFVTWRTSTSQTSNCHLSLSHT